MAWLHHGSHSAHVCAAPLQVVLMKWNTCVVEAINKDADGAITSISAKFAPGGNFKKSVKLTWICDSVRWHGAWCAICLC